MIRDIHNVIPISLALLLHVIIFGSLIFVIDFRDRSVPVVPLAIQATLVTDNAVVIPPKVEEPPPPQPEPDTSEQDRIRAEEQKRLEDARIEQERINRIRKAEEEAAAERRRKVEEEAAAEQRRKDEEARLERERQEAERLRQVEIERQRQENERLRAEAEAARQAELDAESERLEVMQANAKAAYMYAIQSRVMNRWSRPASAKVGMECVANIKQLPGGEVVSVSIGACNADSVTRQSIVAAIHLASPLPTPADPSVFEREIRLTFRPEED